MELSGLSVEEFAHPEEKAALEGLKKVKPLERLLNWVADANTQVALRTEILGNYFEVTRESMPRLYDLAGEVCRVLDYDCMPRIYMYRNEGLGIKAFAGEIPLLVFPDFVIREFDEEMLRFQLGRAVTSLKASTDQLKMAAMAIGAASNLVPFAGELVVSALAGWSRKAALTEDRGGLLACQDIDTAMKVLLRTAGIPIEYLEVSRLTQYIKAYEPVSRLSGAFQYLNTLVRLEPWNNDRILELYHWYRSGEYDDILDEYETVSGDLRGK